MAINKNSVISEARKFAAKGLYDKAIAEWKKLLSETPNDANLYNTIGDLCIKKNSRAEAVDAYKRAADILAEDGFTSKAIALYKKILNIDMSRIEVHLALGDMHAEKGLTGNALQNYKYAADYCKKENKIAESLGIYQKMADLDPSNVAFRIKLADMYAKERMTAEAVEAYLAAADVHLSKDAVKEARHLFEKVLSLDPGNKAVYYKAGIAYLKEEKYSEACKALKPAFESDPGNRELSDTYIEALAKAGKDSDAEHALQKVLAADPGRADLREKLCALYIAKNEFEKALDAATVLAHARIGQNDQGGAEEVFKKFVTDCPHFAPARRALAELYDSLNRSREAAGSYLEEAKILSEEGDRESAKSALSSALDRVPDLQEARDFLENLSSAVSDPPPAEPEREEAGEAVPEPVAVADSERTETPAPEQFPAGPEMTVEEPAAEGAPAEPAEAPAAWTEPIAEDRTAAVEQMDPAVAEALIEADVLVKYGLSSKAIEQLEGLAKKFPENMQLRIKLRDLHAGHAPSFDDFTPPEDLPELAAPAVDAADTMPAPEPVPTDEIVIPGLDAGAPRTDEEPPAGMELPPFDETPPANTETSPITGEEQAPDAFDEQSGAPDTAPDIYEAMPPADEGPGSPSMTEEPAEPFGQEPSAPEHIGEKPEGGSDALSEIWAEAEFYFQQGLFSEAKKHYSRIIELSPGESRAIERLAELSREEEDTREFLRLADAAAGLRSAQPPEESAGEMPFSETDKEAVRSLMQEIAQLKQPREKPPAPPAAKGEAIAPSPRREAFPEQPYSPRPPQKIFDDAGPAASGTEEDYFDLGAELDSESGASASAKQKQEPDDFFDLAAELREELSVEPPAPHASPAGEQSLDEIFEEFKQGVENQSAREEEDTHYNLGVAYREMGLLDDAIAELIRTPNNEPKFAQSRYMLGLCYMEKGEYQKAIGEIRNALDNSESTGEGSQDIIGMYYDLGLAYQGAGNIADALREFQKVKSMDAHYRDIAGKIKDLRKGDYISLVQLKDDIEKEISEKFSEEGSRIEREEKNRRNEKVRR